MKKRMILLLSLIATALALLFGIQYMLSFHKISFVIDESVSAITVLDASDKQVGSLTTSGQLQLREGDYAIIPSGDNIATDKISFSVETDDKTIAVAPPYSKNYLQEALTKELASIKEAVASKYPSLYPKYSLINGALYQKGEWFGGLLAPKVADIRNQKDAYRIVLHKKDGTWEVIRRPEYVLTSSRYGEVPDDVLRQINQIIQ